MVKLDFGVVNNKYADKDISVSEVALINEYGTDEIPPRPAFRVGLEKAVKDNKPRIDAALKNITNHLLTGRKDSINKNLTQLLVGIGKSAKKNTKDLIKSGTTPPPNAPSTIARKGHGKTLYDTGLLLESVEYFVSE